MHILDKLEFVLADVTVIEGAVQEYLSAVSLRQLYLPFVLFAGAGFCAAFLATGLVTVSASAARTALTAARIWRRVTLPLP